VFLPPCRSSVELYASRGTWPIKGRIFFVVLNSQKSSCAWRPYVGAKRRLGAPGFSPGFENSQGAEWICKNRDKLLNYTDRVSF
jgi:hypothetical protein